MNTKLRLSAKIFFTVVVSGLPVASFSSTVEVTKEQGSPIAYDAASNLNTALSQVNQINSLNAAGGLTQADLAGLNVHGGNVSAGSHALTQTAKSSKISASATPCDLTVSTVNYLGTNGVSQTLEVDGNFPSGTKLSLNCTKSSVPQYPTPVSISATQIVLTLPNNLIDRGCYIGDNTSNTDYFDFVLPGLTCDQDKSLCTGLYRDGIATRTSDGQRVTVNIQDAPYSAASFTSGDVIDIKTFLETVPANHLKYVQIIQTAPPEPLTGDYYTDVIINTHARAGNGNEIYVSVEPNGNEDIRNDVANGIASEIFAQLSTQDKAVFGVKPEDQFDLMYSDWYKNQNFSLYPMIKNGINTILSDAERAADIEQILSMASLFYDPNQKGLITYGQGPGAARPELIFGTPVTFTGNTLKINTYTFHLDGNTIVSITDPNGHEVPMPAGTVIPDSFLRTVPRT